MRRPSPARVARLAALAALAATLGSCAYYNTFYYARKYYFRATAGAPLAPEEGNSQNLPNYNKAIDYSKKVIANYPRSKWVDDAYLLWAAALLGKNDPLETVNMLGDFETRFPRSPVADDARFVLGAAYRRARQYANAVATLDDYLQRRPKGRYAPDALLERSKALVSLGRPEDAAAAAGAILERFPKSPLAERARAARAEAWFAAGSYGLAREDYRFMGARSRDDQERLEFLLREAECLEAARDFDEALGLLRDALSHETEPRLPDTTGGRPLIVPTGPVAERWGRLMIRLGSVELRAGRLEPALEAFERVADRYPRTPIAAEATYRIGYAQETAADDFEAARAAYAKVREQSAGSAFNTQAQQRLVNLDRLAQFATAGGDSLEKQAEAGFLLAEQYLFQLDRPERAADEYARLASRYAGTAWGGKALNAQAWVLRRRLDREAEADSLWWHVVRRYPATEAQLAARDFLELKGQVVPESLIVRPAPPPPPAAADTVALTPTPAAAPRLGAPPGGIFAPADSTGARGRGLGLPGGVLPIGAAPDSLRAAGPVPGAAGAKRDSIAARAGDPGAKPPAAPGAPKDGPPGAPGPPGAARDSAGTGPKPLPPGVPAPPDTTVAPKAASGDSLRGGR